MEFNNISSIFFFTQRGKFFKVVAIKNKFRALAIFLDWAVGRHEGEQGVVL